MVEIKIVYEGNLRSRAVHAPSGTELITDAPKDNHGQGESFSPTDLVATALGACILTVMGIAARKMQIDLEGTKVTVHKEMVTEPVRRIGKLTTLIEVPGKISDKHKENLINIVHTCPVHQSLHPDVLMPIEFRWA